MSIVKVNQTKLDELNAKNQEILDLQTAKETAGLKNITIKQAQNWINNHLDSATNAAETKEAIREIFLKMVPYLLG